MKVYTIIYNIGIAQNNNNNNNSNFMTNNDNASTCNLCGVFDPNFDEDSLLMHFYKDCPMV